MRRVEVDPEPVDRQLGRPAREHWSRVAEGQPERERRAAGERLERLGQVGEAGVLPCEERLGASYGPAVETLNRRLRDALCALFSPQTRPAGETQMPKRAA